MRLRVVWSGSRGRGSQLSATQHTASTEAIQPPPPCTCTRADVGRAASRAAMRRGGGRNRSLLDLSAYGLVGCALLFSAYCVLRVDWSIEGSGDGGAVARKLVTTGSGGAVIEKIAAGGQEKQAGVNSPLQAGAIGIEGQKAREKPCPEVQRLAPRIMSAAVSVRNPRKYHLVTTAQGFSNAWQARIHYYWCGWHACVRHVGPSRAGGPCCMHAWEQFCMARANGRAHSGRARVPQAHA